MKRLSAAEVISIRVFSSLALALSISPGSASFPTSTGSPHMKTPLENG